MSDRKEEFSMERWREAFQSEEILVGEHKSGVQFNCRTTGWKRVNWAGGKRA